MRRPVTTAIATSRARILLGEPHGFEGRGRIHVSLDTNDASAAHFEDDRRLGLELDSAAPPAPVFALQHDNAIAGVDEVLRLEAALIPCIEVLFLEDLHELFRATRDPALLKAADGATELEIRIDQLRHAVPIASQGGVVRAAHYLHVLLRHRPRSIPQAQESA